MRMRLASVGVALLVLTSPRAELPKAAANDNTVSGGSLGSGTFTIVLEARRAVWQADGDSLPGRETAAFAEEGKVRWFQARSSASPPAPW